MRPFLDSTAEVENGPELLRRLHRDSYLFVRGLLPEDVLEVLRMQILEIAREAGWIKSGTQLEEGIADLDGFCVEPEPAYMEILRRIYKLAALHGLQHHPKLIQLFERMTGGPVMPHPRIISRMIFPQREAYTTPPHQDFIPIQGTADTYTTWIPLSDIPPEMGGLQISSGSHKHGVFEFRPAMGAGGMEVVDPLEDTWVSGPFKQSDVLIFHSMTVHKGLPNRGDRLRLSIDARYQKISDPIDGGSLKPHAKPITWEEVYADWPPGGVQYFWKKWDLKVIEYDHSYHQRRDRMAFEMAAHGDRTAISALQRIVSRDVDPDKREKAEKLLAVLSTNEEES